VLLDGQPVRSCSLRVSAAEGKKVTTIEGLGRDGALHRGPTEVDRVPGAAVRLLPIGQILAAAALLESNPHPSDADIDAAMTNVCRCGTYSRIRAAIHAAAKV